MNSVSERRSDELLTLLEDELLASRDEDVVAAPGALELAQRVRGLLDAKLKARPVISGRAPARRSRPLPWANRGRDAKRAMIDRVLVASPAAGSHIEAGKLATMNDEELEHLLSKLHALGFLSGGD